LLAFLAATHHLSIFPFSSQVVDAVRDRLAAFELPKGTIRFTAATPLQTPDPGDRRSPPLRCRATYRPGRVPGQHGHRREQPTPTMPASSRPHLPPQESCRTACAARPKVLCSGTLVRGARCRHGVD
jgi:hypothetical protein